MKKFLNFVFIIIAIIVFSGCEDKEHQEEPNELEQTYNELENG